MVVVGVAVRTDEASTVLAVRLRLNPVSPDHFELALVTRRPRRTARSGGKHVVRVHRPDDEYRAVPSRLAGSALQRAYDAVHAEHADRGEEALPSLVRHRNRQLVCERRQVEGSVQKRILVVDGHRGPAYNAIHAGYAFRAQGRQDEGPRFVGSVRTLVLRPDVVRVPDVARKRIERRQVRPVREYVSGRGLVSVGEKVEDVTRGRVEPAARAARGRRAGRARRTGTRAREAGTMKTVARLLVGRLDSKSFWFYLGQCFPWLNLVGNRCVVEIATQIPVTTNTKTRPGHKIVTLFGPEVRMLLLLIPAPRPTAGTQIRQHLFLPLPETVHVHPESVPAPGVAARNLNCAARMDGTDGILEPSRAPRRQAAEEEIPRLVGTRAGFETLVVPPPLVRGRHDGTLLREQHTRLSDKHGRSEIYRTVRRLA